MNVSTTQKNNLLADKLPTVSVVIPAKNRKEIAVRAIESALKQEAVIVEVILVNDGSKDGTEDYVKQKFPSVILINNRTSVGGATARNIGAGYANGAYVAFLDSDDEWLPDHLEKKVKVIKEKGADGVYSSFYLKDDNETRPINFYESFPQSYGIADKISSFQVHDARTSTFVFKKEAFLDVRFEDGLKKHQDWDLAINFEKKYKLIGVNEPTVIIHVDSLHARMSNNLKHDTTLYFLNKNKTSFQAKSLYDFCTKMVMRCQALNEPEAIKPYLQLMATVLPKLSLKEKLLYFLLKYKLINLDSLRKLRKQVRSVSNK